MERRIGVLKVMFVMILINRFDSRQNKANEIDEEIAEDLVPPYCQNPSPDVRGSACRFGENTTLRFKFMEFGEIGENVWIGHENHNCYEFSNRKYNGSYFSAKTLEVVGNCTYILFSSSRGYYIHGLRSVRSVCPKSEPLCIINKQVNAFATCPVKNFTVIPIVHRNNHKYINLNLTWEKINYKASIHIVRNKSNRFTDSKVMCWTMEPLPKHSLLNNYIVKPNMLTDEEVHPGCQYRISIISESSGFGNQFKCDYNYTVPEHVEDIYDCDTYGPLPNILSVEPTDNAFLVKWDPGEKSRNDQNYTIKHVDFKYNLGPFYSESAKELFFNEPEGISKISMKLINGKNYTLVGTFENNFSCTKDITFKFIASTRSNNNILITTILVIAVLIFITVFNYRNIARCKNKVLNLIIPSRRSLEISELARLPSISVPMNINIQYAPVGVLKGLVDQYEFPRKKIIIKEIIGSGAFGQVYLAKAIGIGGIEKYKMVAVKTLGEREFITQEETNDFIAEIEIFKKIGRHPNIVALLGCCTLEPPYMMIMEFVPCGDLKNYLLELREQWLKTKNIVAGRQIIFSDYSDGAYIETAEVPTTLKPVTSSKLLSTTESVTTSLENSMTPFLVEQTQILDKVLDHTELQNFALQIAKGMAHLEKVAVTHRDLAARNILINEFKTLKISDFGLSRSGSYINHKTKKLPLRWMAIEAIVDQKYDNKSDVWSFGVVLWEIGTLGAFPYGSVPDSFIQQFLQLGRRLERPEICTDELYSLMKDCWATDPEKRPTFQELVDALDVKKQKVYVNFSQLNPTYLFPPSDLKAS